MILSFDFLRKFKSITIGNLKSLIFNLESHSIALRILNLFKIRNTQLLLFKLYGMAMCLNLESLDREILQMKITIFE